MKTPKSDIYSQVARTGLLPDDLATAILADQAPPIEEIVLQLVITSWDAYAVVLGATESSKTERCIAHLVLAAAFLSAMAVVGDGEAENRYGVPTATQEGRDGTQ
jgi:hypothetical protein